MSSQVNVVEKRLGTGKTRQLTTQSKEDGGAARNSETEQPTQGPI